MYYDRRGKSITLDVWAAALETDRRVRETTLPSGKWVSTIWLGLDHRFGEGSPLIFETMVFPPSDDRGERSWRDLDCDRYSTESEAIAGHEAMIVKWSTRE